MRGHGPIERPRPANTYRSACSPSLTRPARRPTGTPRGNPATCGSVGCRGEPNSVSTRRCEPPAADTFGPSSSPAWSSPSSRARCIGGGVARHNPRPRLGRACEQIYCPPSRTHRRSLACRWPRYARHNGSAGKPASARVCEPARAKAARNCSVASAGSPRSSANTPARHRRSASI